MRRTFFLLSMLLLFAASSYTQVAINDDGSNPNPAAMLDVQSTNKGLLMPRMTNTMMAAIPNPVDGLMVYSTDDKQLYIFSSVDNAFRSLQLGAGSVTPQAVYVLGAKGACANNTLYGIYEQFIDLDASNYVTMDVNVISPGTWSITAPDVGGGFYFHGTGVFTTTGTVQVTIYGSGSPVGAGPYGDYIFTAQDNYGLSNCTFGVGVIELPPPSLSGE